MKKLNNIFIFIIIPILILGLLYVNAELQSKKYAQTTEDFKQYNADISTDIEYIKAKSGEVIQQKVTVKNLGTMTWIVNEDNSINLSYHILRKDGKKEVLFEGIRTHLTQPVRAGESLELLAEIEAPKEVGMYLIELDMVHEGTTWFKEKGSITLTIHLEVE